MKSSTAVVYTTFNLADAELVRSRLESAGFHAEVLNETAALTLEGYALAAGGVRVVVPASEAEDAKQFLKDDEAQSGQQENN
ncbi:MAG: DUF2007 domain-containing protein [Verrucomicrobiota bacterium]|nr:DUF2007 domain-containing protein [Verrucomicrobiota bacterium]